MAWRWAERARTQRHAHEVNVPDLDEDMPEPARPASVPASWEWIADTDDAWCGWVEPEEQALARRRGYCGLAGRPDTDR